MLGNNFGIVILNAPPLHSLSNGQVERFHGTLGDIARSFKLETQVEDTVENILLALGTHACGCLKKNPSF